MKLSKLESLWVKFVCVFTIMVVCVSCTMLADMALDQVVGGSKGGISCTEEQV